MANAFTPNENNALGCVLEDPGGCGMFNYEKVAAAWGGYGELVTDPNEIIPAIRRAQVSGNPAIINVRSGMISLLIPQLHLSCMRV